MKLSNPFARPGSSTDLPQPPVARGDYGTISYSQDGEDLVLRRYLKPKATGFYVDIGAHHPTRFSNTNYFYQQGWRGLNVDADPDLIAEFSLERPHDINISSGVGVEGELIFNIFSERAVNTFDEKLAREYSKIKGWKLIEKRSIAVRSLKNILNKYLPRNQKIDFMSIDVEGKDLEVLKSNDWKKYRPDFLLVECAGMHFLDATKTNPTATYLMGQRYVPVAKTLQTVIFANKDSYAKK